MKPRVRLAVLVYAAFAPDPEDARSRAVRLAAAAVDRLAAVGVAVHQTSIVDSADPPASGPVDALVVIPATAAPPEWAARCARPGEPVLIWDMSSADPLPDHANQTLAHRETGAVGAVMAGGGLIAAGRRPEVVSGPEAAVAVRAALDRLLTEPAPIRVLRIGRPIDGYTTMATSAEALARVGAELVDAELDPVQGNADARSRAVAAQLGRMADGFDVVAVNCHGSALRNNTGVGVTACLAASGAVPTACTADIPTAWLLAALARLGHPALYLEPYTVDDARAAVLLANCGIGNRRLARPSSWAEQPTQYYPGCRGRGLSVAMAVKPGPACFLAVRPDEQRWEITLIAGRVLLDTITGFGGAYAFFRPAEMTPREMIATLARLGAVHHGALARARPAALAALEGADGSVVLRRL